MLVRLLCARVGDGQAQWFRDNSTMGVGRSAVCVVGGCRTI